MTTWSGAALRLVTSVIARSHRHKCGRCSIHNDHNDRHQGAHGSLLRDLPPALGQRLHATAEIGKTASLPHARAGHPASVSASSSKGRRTAGACGQRAALPGILLYRYFHQGMVLTAMLTGREGAAGGLRGMRVSRTARRCPVNHRVRKRISRKGSRLTLRMRVRSFVGTRCLSGVAVASRPAP